MKHFTLRISDDDYDLFMRIADLECSSLAASFRRAMLNSAQAHGLRSKPVRIITQNNQQVTHVQTKPGLPKPAKPDETVLPNKWAHLPEPDYDN